MSNKISEKDKNDWQKFINSKEKIKSKDINLYDNIKKNQTCAIDLHGFSIENANKTIDDLINKSFVNKVEMIKIITGKGLRSKHKENPYLSKDLSILKYAVPEYIKTSKNLMKMIKEIKEASIEDGGSGAFYIYLKNNIKI